jgi:uncharacterized protein with PIN domain
MENRINHFPFSIYFDIFLVNEFLQREKNIMSELSLEDRGQALENEYFRRQERELIEKMKAKLEAEHKDASNLNCPKCDGKLVETDYENIKMDVCNKCHGVWLDAGELAQIQSKDQGGWFGKIFG